MQKKSEKSSQLPGISKYILNWSPNVLRWLTVSLRRYGGLHFGASDKGEQKVLDVYLDKKPSMVLDKERGTFQEELERFSICQNYQKREILWYTMQFVIERRTIIKKFTWFSQVLSAIDPSSLFLNFSCPQLMSRASWHIGLQYISYGFRVERILRSVGNEWPTTQSGPLPGRQ